MTRRALRSLARAVHLVIALALATYLYVPLSVPTGPLRALLMYAGVPLATLSGLYLWQQARVHRWVVRP
jgi:thiosulfate reductase cytochrome b subunit